MKTAKALALTASLCFVFAASSEAAILAEHVTGGHLDQAWVGGFGTPNSMYGKTLTASEPGYANPSGDHTVAVAQNASPDSGGIIVTTTDPGAIDGDYVWEGQIFTGNGETRRGLIVRATPGNDFESFYMLVIEPGLFQIRFRKLIGMTPTTLASWFATVLPAGSIPVNTWHKLKIIAQGSSFRCFFDDYELTTAPIVDGELTGGWVGVYNFKFDLGNVPVYFDDLVLSCITTTPVAFDLEPGTLNLASMGRWVSGRITVDAPATANDLDVSSIRLNDRVAVDPDAPVEVLDGGQTLAVKFRRADLFLAVAPGDDVTVTASGVLAGGCFEGTDVVRVRSPQVNHPHANDAIAPGTSLLVDWDRTGNATTVAILASMNDGESWDLVTKDAPNSGSYAWTVPNRSTSTARLAVVEIESTDPGDPTGYTVTGALGISEAFTITGTLDVPAAVTEFALHALGNPSRGALRVACSLPSAETATLAVFDVTGRAIGSREVAGAGPHVVKLADWAPPGAYVVRLTQGGRIASTRISVVR